MKNTNNLSFSLRHVKYIVTPLIIGLMVSFWLYVFPPKKKEIVLDFGKNAINTAMASSDTVISKKNLYGDKSETTMASEAVSPNTALGSDITKEDLNKNSKIKAANEKAEFVRETNQKAYRSSQRNNQYVSGNDHINYQRNNQYASGNDNNNYQRNNQFRNENQGYNPTPPSESLVKQLKERIKVLETNQKGRISKDSKKDSNEIVVKNGKRYDKNGLLLLPEPSSDLKAAFLSKNDNGFYSNGKRENYDIMSSIYNSSVGGLKATAGGDMLIKGRLVDDKMVRDFSTIRIMIMESAITKNGFHVEKGQLLSAKCSLSAGGDRLNISINGYIRDDEFYAIEGKVVDLYGGEGLAINSSIDMKLTKRSWGQSAGSALGSINPLLINQPSGNIGTTIANQVVGSLVNQTMNGANQFVSAKINDVKANIKTGQLLYIILKTK